jgi:hypothetical protein
MTIVHMAGLITAYRRYAAEDRASAAKFWTEWETSPPTTRLSEEAALRTVNLHLHGAFLYEEAVTRLQEGIELAVMRAAQEMGARS